MHPASGNPGNSKIMQLHEVRPTHRKKRKKRVGRGGAHGTFSGRGSKGQKSRAGHMMKPAIREVIKRYPKLRGYRFRSAVNQRDVLNVEILDKKFKDSERVSPDTLIRKRIIRRIKGRMPLVKILGGGKITKPLIIEKCLLSKSAKEKIEKAGGKIIS